MDLAILQKIFNKTAPYKIGLEIGARSIKMLELSHVGEGYQIESFGISYLPVNAYINADVKDPPLVGEAVASLINPVAGTVRDIIISLPGSSVVIKRISMDAALSIADIEAQAWVEAEKSFPQLIEEVSLDFQVLGATPNKESQVDVLLVACRKEHIQSRMSALQEANLQAKAVDVDYYAFARALAWIHGQQADQTTESKTVALLNLGIVASTLIVMQNNTLLYSHDQAFNGQQLIEQVETQLGIKSLYSDYLPLQDKVDGEKQDAIKELIRQNLLAHVRHFLQFFYSNHHGAEIESLFLAGDCAMIPGVASFIEEQIGITTRIANPLMNMKVASSVDTATLNHVAPALMLSCGLALHQIHQ